MYPVGVLFGFGERTVCAYANDLLSPPLQKALIPRHRLRSSRYRPSQRRVQIRKVSLRGTSSSCLLGPFCLTPLEVETYPHDQMLFTAGMTLLDSIDSILMLYSYTGFAEHRFHLFEPIPENDARDHVYREAATTSISPVQLPRSGGSHENETEPYAVSAPLSEQSEQNRSSQGNIEQPVEVQLEDTEAKIRDIRKEAQRELVVKRNMMSGLSILLTLMSIIVAFRYEFPAQPTGGNPRTDRRFSLPVYH